MAAQLAEILKAITYATTSMDRGTQKKGGESHNQCPLLVEEGGGAWRTADMQCPEPNAVHSPDKGRWPSLPPWTKPDPHELQTNSEQTFGVFS